ncbi:DUF1573 domain-containing protein [Allorhodopirellula solitaria]|uniref:DUF1573 domain-containing protein n=1 Tax=Allorhodopirellula solitaria TaxID=2527987 RepID=A0A5C5X1N9_9BACT|nr:DUF1573 domain-containing protein [Allorhodopirellula solitaria]TWT56075.1 hypothetical protein CA85_45480 [Allorhodopirellula solitaria]
MHQHEKAFPLLRYLKLQNTGPKINQTVRSSRWNSDVAKLSRCVMFLLLLLLLLSGNGRASAQELAPHVFDVTTSKLLNGGAVQIDLGNLASGTTTKLDLEITNDQPTTVSVSFRAASCGCTSAEPSELVIASGETRDLKVSVKSNRSDGVTSIVTLSLHVSREGELAFARRVAIRFASRTDYSLTLKNPVSRFIAGVDDSVSTEIVVDSFYGKSLEGLEVRCSLADCELTKVSNTSNGKLLYLAKLKGLTDSSMSRVGEVRLVRADETKEKTLARAKVYIRAVEPISAYPRVLTLPHDRLTIVFAEGLSLGRTIVLRCEKGGPVIAEPTQIGKRIVSFDRISIPNDCQAISVVNEATDTTLAQIPVKRTPRFSPSIEGPTK